MRQTGSDVSRQKADAVLVHTDALCFCLFGELSVQAFWYTQFELTGIGLQL